MCVYRACRDSRGYTVMFINKSSLARKKGEPRKGNAQKVTFKSLKGDLRVT